MTQNTRKFAGTFLMIGLLLVYPLIASVVYERLLTGQNRWVLLIYFVVAGLFWAVPAGMLIKWMARPD